MVRLPCGTNLIALQPVHYSTLVALRRTCKVLHALLGTQYSSDCTVATLSQLVALRRT